MYKQYHLEDPLNFRRDLSGIMINRRWLFFVFILWGTLAFHATANEEEQTCSSGTSALYDDPNLQPMTVNLGDGTSENDAELTTFDAYVSPDIATFYNKTAGSVRAVEPSFRGQFGKFINLSNKKIQVYWQPTSGKNRQPSYISDVAPFGGAGTATYPGHVFIVVEPTTPKVDQENALAVWTMKKGQSLYSYDPYGSLEEATKALFAPELELYKLQRNSLAFNSLYRKFTNREWLALYGRKHPPRLPMWPADYFDQTHTFSTKETHFQSIPPTEKWKKVPWYSMPDEEREYLQEHRTLVDVSSATLNMTMTVLSVSPRVFEIKNFLSEEECHHILELATGMKLSRSTTRAGSIASSRSNDDTRTSQNSWLSRQRSPIVDSIYRRTADLLQIDEAFLRDRQGNETQLVPESTEPISERLQLVHYSPGQQYTPHHDFSVPDLKDGQASRFATILLYLNEVEEGGETSFPRWLNAETSEQLKVKPEVGKAVLFYSVLPDGNYDERSQHAALPVTKGEKWLTNLWVWDPYMH